MRIVAIILNLILIGVVVFLFATDGAPNGKEWLLVVPMIAAPICSLIAILGSKGDKWLSLYFKRKALEEKKKIEDLSNYKIKS